MSAGALQDCALCAAPHPVYHHQGAVQLPLARPGLPGALPQAAGAPPVQMLWSMRERRVRGDRQSCSSTVRAVAMSTTMRCGQCVQQVIGSNPSLCWAAGPGIRRRVPALPQRDRAGREQRAQRPHTHQPAGRAAPGGWRCAGARSRLHRGGTACVRPVTRLIFSPAQQICTMLCEVPESQA